MTRRSLLAMIAAPLLCRGDETSTCEVTIQRVGTDRWFVWTFDDSGAAVVTPCRSCREALDTAHRILIADIA